MQNSVGILRVLFDARGKMPVTVEDGSLFENGPQRIEVVGVNFVALRGLIQVHQRRDMMEKRGIRLLLDKAISAELLAACICVLGCLLLFIPTSLFSKLIGVGVAG